MCVCHCDNTNSFGGLEKQAFALARELNETHEVIMLSSTKRIKNIGWGNLHGIKTLKFWSYTTPQVGGKKLPASIIWAMQLLLWLLINRKKVDVFHCHQIRIHAFVAAFCNKFFNMKTVLKSGVGGKGADINAIGTHKYFGKLGQSFVKNNNSKFISITKTISIDLKEVGILEEDIVVIPNGFDVLKVKSVQPNFINSKAKFIYLGRLDSDKNVLELVNAALSLRENYDFELNIYGRGPLKEILEQIVDDECADNYIKILNYVEDISLVLENNCWFILPSNAEGLSNSMIEAMACGVVPLVTKVSGAIDHIRHGENGYFIDGFSEKGIKVVLALALQSKSDKWLKMSNCCKFEALENFSMSSVGNQYRELYKKLNGKNIK
tara:strand:- start:2648 stop:3787 length:1140 start_codon:yes stop_codon:yes gene_type:complete